MIKLFSAIFFAWCLPSAFLLAEDEGPDFCTIMEVSNQSHLNASIHTAKLGDHIVVKVRGLGSWLKEKITDGIVIDPVNLAMFQKNSSPSQDSLWQANADGYARQMCLFINRQPSALLPIDTWWEPETNGQANDNSGCPRYAMLEFVLTKEGTKNLWADLVKGQGLQSIPVDMSVGFDKTFNSRTLVMSSSLNPLKTDSNYNPSKMFYITPAVGSFLGWVSSLWVVFLLVVASICMRSDILRDTTSFLNANGRPPLSLGLCQMLVWLLVIISCYIFLWCITLDCNQMSSTAYALLGISAVTGLGAVLINQLPNPNYPGGLTAADLPLDATALKETIPGANPARVEALQKRIAFLNASRAERLGINLGLIFTDLLRENQTVSLHRLQLIIWTMVFVFIFVYNVIYMLVMPIFDASLLILMGISSTTYIGFKFPASQS